MNDRIHLLLRKLALAKASIHAVLMPADIAIFQEFSPPPAGGGNQFLMALRREFEQKAFRVENNRISFRSRACLFNSYNFDFGRLRYFKRKTCRMVHRVDGPISVYRSRDDGTDKRIYEVNQELADATVFQSDYSLKKHESMGMRFKDPVVIHNSVSSEIFNSINRVKFDHNRKIRIMSASWSDNINKGAPVYQWLEDKLDWRKYEFTFVGRAQVKFTKIRMLDPMPSNKIADIMRQHDIFISASMHESCPNVILEALACGMPVIYHNSGGSPEVVGSAGLGFNQQAEIPDLLDRLSAEYEKRASMIKVPDMAEVALRYLEVMGLSGDLSLDCQGK